MLHMTRELETGAANGTLSPKGGRFQGGRPRHWHSNGSLLQGSAWEERRRRLHLALANGNTSWHQFCSHNLLAETHPLAKRKPPP